MKWENSIWVITLTVLIASMLLVSDNIKSVYALNLTSYASTTGLYYAIQYDSTHNMIIVVHDINGTNYSIDVLNVDSTNNSMTLARTIQATTIGSVGQTATLSPSSITLDEANYIAYIGSCKTGLPAGSNDCYITAINYNTGVIVNQTTNGTECIFEGIIKIGSLIFATVKNSGGGTCSPSTVNTSIFTFDLTLTLQTITSGYDSGVTETMRSLCYDSSTGKLWGMGTTGANPRAKSFIVSTNTWSQTVGSGVTVYGQCVVDGTNVYVVHGTGLDKIVQSSGAQTTLISGITGLSGVGYNSNLSHLYITETNTDTIKIYSVAGALISTLPLANNPTTVRTSLNRETAITREDTAGTGKVWFIGEQSSGSDDLEDTGEEETGNAVDGVCGLGTALDCVGDRSLINTISGAPSITSVANDLGVGIGIINSTNTDIKTNGTGLFLMLITGTFFSTLIIATIAVSNNKFGTNISYSSIPKEVWLFLVIGVVAVAFYLAWIPDIVFYGMIIGLAGLFSFGLYRQFGGHGG